MGADYYSRIIDELEKRAETLRAYADELRHVEEALAALRGVRAGGTARAEEASLSPPSPDPPAGAAGPEDERTGRPPAPEQPAAIARPAEQRSDGPPPEQQRDVVALTDSPPGSASSIRVPPASASPHPSALGLAPTPPPNGSVALAAGGKRAAAIAASRVEPAAVALLEAPPVADAHVERVADAGPATMTKVASSGRRAGDDAGLSASQEAPGPAPEPLADPERLAALRTSGLLEQDAEGAFDRITQLVQRLLGVSSATVTLLDDQWQHFHSPVPREARFARDGKAPASESFCQYAVSTGERLLVEDARTNLLVRESRAVADQDVLAYAGEPLATRNGHVLGVLCAIEEEPRTWSEPELDLLKELAALATTEIEHRLALRGIRRVESLARQLTESIEMLGEAVGSVVSIAEQTQAPPRLVRFASLAQTRFGAVESIERELRESVASRAGANRSSRRVVDLVERMERAARLATVTARHQDLRLTAPSERVDVECDSYALDRALSHLFVMMLSHGADSGGVDAMLQRDGDQARLEVQALEAVVPTTDLTSMVSRLGGVCLGDSEAAEGAADTCSLTRSGRTTIAETRRVRGTTSPTGTVLGVTFRLAAVPD